MDDLFELDPFEAILAAAWVRQKGLPSSVNRLAADPPRGGAPWDKEYWRKERVRQALMQIAARAPHRLKWSGKDQILALSGANSFVFLSICHEIWDAMHRARRAAKVTRDEQGGGSVIDRNAQSVGIYAASEVWYRKIIEQPGGSDRQRFVDVLGSKFRDWLLDDNAMSHPGRNGFSLDLAELKERPRVAEFLKDAVAYGDLYSVAHTTKERDRKPRQKWYLSPILSPFFQIPETHTKEPYYARVGEVEAWLLEADVHLEDVNAGHGVTTPHAPRARKKSRESAPRHIPDLFGGTEGDS